MKVQFTQSGGFAGLIRQCTLDTATMGPDEAKTLETLVRQADLSSPRPPLSASSRDLEEYQIAVDDGGASVTVVLDKSSRDPGVAALVGYLKKCARPGAPPK